MENRESTPPEKFSARYPFPHNPPFPTVFAERVPLLYALRLAVQQYQTRTKIYPSRWKRLLSEKCRINLGRPFVSAECGVYSGNSLLATGRLLTYLGVRAELFGLDTFSGLPSMSPMDRKFLPAGAAHIDRTLFADTSVESVRSKIEASRIWAKVNLIEGLFSDTLPTLPERMYDFVNIDCDLYEPHIDCLQYFYSRTHPGGIILFDDYHSAEYPMAKAAIDSFLEDKQETLAHLRYGDDGINHTKAFFQKL